MRCFGLGAPLAEPVRVLGGLSNDLWRVVTADGTFAVKRMVANAERVEFAGDVEASFAVELHAWRAGVPIPEPIVYAGRALAAVAGSWWRVHRWVESIPGTVAAVDAARLLASIHAVGRPRWAQAPESGWDGSRWGDDVAGLARRVAAPPERMLLVDSHRDLDRKNVVLGADGRVLAVDWDAAGPVGAVPEVVAVALDWSDGDPRVFADCVRAYGGLDVPGEPWVFGYWVAAQGGWLDYTGGDEPLDALRRLAGRLDEFVAALV
jgi:hypothetical protein